MKAEAVIASAFVIVFRLVRDVVNHKTTRFTGGSDYCANFIVYVIIRFWRFYRIPRHLHQEAYRTQ